VHLVKVLILGITGFAGRAALNMFSSQGLKDISGTYRHSTANRGISKLNGEPSLYECDINEAVSIENVLNEIKPDIIFHFCSYVSVFSSLKNPTSTYQTNVIGTINLLEAVKKVVPLAKVLLPGSAEQYGFVSEKKMPIKETYSLNPANPYAVSKKHQEEIGLYYYKQFGLNLYFTRTFHCTGPYQPIGFVCSDIAKQIVGVERDVSSSIKIGNLDAKRDFTDIRDVVAAYWQIINDGVPGQIYNVCVGKSISIQNILDKLIGFSGKNIQTTIDQSKLRKSDVPDFIGCNTKLKKIGWTPKYTIEQSLEDLLNRTRAGSYEL
jgi:GDP-4-dehydro-6-deoxy-D-mannose reductase